MKRFRVWRIVMVLAVFVRWPVALAQCPPPPPAAENPMVRFEVVQPRLIYRHDLDLLGLAGFSDTFETPAEGGVVLGLTRRNDSFSIATRVVASKIAGGRSCIWVAEVDAQLGGSDMDVYVASNYPVGSCEYDQVMAHENAHVAINNSVLEAYAPRIGAKLREAVHHFPLVTNNISDGKRVPGLLTEQIKPIYDAMIAELRRRNHALDTPESYRKSQDQCHNWFPPGTRLPSKRR